MAEDSIGKVSLELGVEASDIGAQLESLGQKIGSGIGKSIKGAMGNIGADKLVSGIGAMFQKTMSNVEASVNRTLEQCLETAKQKIDVLGEYMAKTIEKAMARFTDVKAPAPTVESSAGVRESQVSVAQPRAPPMVRVKAPEIKIDYTKDMLDAQMEQIDQITNNVGKQIDVQEAKLESLKETYDRTFNESKKSKIQEQIVKTEGAVVSLKGKLMDLGFQYDALENKMAAMTKQPDIPAPAAPRIKAVNGHRVQIPKVNAAPSIKSVDGLSRSIGQTGDAAQKTGSSLIRMLQRMNVGKALTDVNRLKTGVEGLLKSLGSNLSSAARKATSAAGRLFKEMGSGVTRITKAGKSLLGFGRSAKKAGQQSAGAQSGMKRMLTTMLRYQIIIPIVMGLLRGMAKSLFASMDANEQFRNSLKQIRSNLNVAFTPIYQAIMPAINTLMAALARLTGYFAAFISTVFGKTLSASVNATKGLVSAKDAMGAYGSAAKKAGKDAKGATTGLDELNVLQDKDSAVGGSGEAPEIIPPEIDTTQMGAIDIMAQKVRDVLAQLFKPLKDSWDAEGQNTVNAAQYAFSNITELAKTVGTSFLEIWTNGTGEQYCTNILNLVTMVFNMVGDIAGAFARAWEAGGRGDALIQSIFGQLNSWLELIHTIGESFREVWNSGTGESMIGHILEIFTNINDTITNIRTNFKEAWQLDGTGTAIIQNLADILDGLLGSVDRITKSLSDWSSTLDFTPILSAFDQMSAALKPLGDKLGTGVEWLFKNVLEPLGKWAVEQAIPVVINAITAAFKAFDNILDALKPVGEWLWENLLKPLASWTGGIILDVIQGITGAFDGLASVFGRVSAANSENISPVIQELSTRFGEFKDQYLSPLIDKFADFAGKVSEAISAVWENFLKPFVLWFSEIAAPGIAAFIQGAVDAFFTFFSGISTVVGHILDALGGLMDFIVGIFTGDWKKAWDGISKFCTSTWESIKAAVETVINTIFSIISGVLNTIKATWEWAWNDIKAIVSKLWDDIKAKVSGVIEDVRKAIDDKITAIKAKWDEIWGGVKSSTENIFSDIWNFIKGTINNILSGIETMANGVVRGVNKMINALNSLSFDIPDWVPVLGGESFGLDIPTIPEVSIPRLAQGGFVEANTPRLAMIGDNQHYGEIVAPEDKMQAMVDKAVAMASGNGMSEQYLSAMVDLLKKIIELIESMDLTVNFDMREIKKKLVELDKRSGYTMRPT